MADNKPISLKSQTDAYNKFYETEPVENKGVSPKSSNSVMPRVVTPAKQMDNIPEEARGQIEERNMNKAYDRFYNKESVEEKGQSPINKKKGGKVSGKDWHGFGHGGKTGKNNHGF